MAQWYNLTTQETLKKLQTQANGLSQRATERRLQKYGLNQLIKKDAQPGLALLWDQFKSPLVYVLIIAGIIALLVHHYLDGLVIFIAVIINAAVGFYQEHKTSRALARLHHLVRQKTYVLRPVNNRKSRRRQIESQFLVPGDVVWLKEGDRVPADCRLLAQHNFLVNESALTGEWLGRLKTTKTLKRQDLVLADQDNLIFMGTIVEQGEAQAIVVATGQATEIGKIASLVRQTKETKTPLQARILQSAHLMALIVALLSLLMIIEGWWRGRGFMEMFIMAVAVAVAAIPEGLPIAITSILAVGTEKILRKKAIIRKLVAAETLGAVSVVCVDKTGTLTEGKMKVNQVVAGRRLLERRFVLKNQAGCLAGLNKSVLEIGLLCSAAFVENPDESRERWLVRGAPTDRALFLAGIEACLNKDELEVRFPLMQHWPFSSKRMFLADRCQLGRQEEIIFISGAPERILERCQFLEVAADKKERLDRVKRRAIQQTQDGLTKRGFRVIAVAKRITKRDGVAAQAKTSFWRRSSDEALLDVLAQKMIFVGLISLHDPLRKDVKDALYLCQQAGIRPVVITGDNLNTAKAIARQLGISTSRQRVLEGREIRVLSDQDLERRVAKINVYARIEPQDKLRIVQAWQNRSEIVAMTGDGLNDAPALKKADVGIAMGEGVDVAKETADVVLLDNSFSVIVAAIEQGRVIFDNIRKMVTYLFSDSFTEILLVVGALFLGTPFLPILPAQILWANLIEDTLPNLALIFEPAEQDVMRLKPRTKKTPLFNRPMKFIIFIIGIFTDLLLLTLFYFLFKRDWTSQHIQTLIFATLSANSLFYVFACRSLRRSLWQIKFWQNKYLIGAVLVGWLMLLAAIYFPPFQLLLRTLPLTWSDWLIIIFLGLVDLGLIELAKYYLVVKKYKARAKISK